jgi:hypothetical protein
MYLQWECRPIINEPDLVRRYCGRSVYLFMGMIIIRHSYSVWGSATQMATTDHSAHYIGMGGRSVDGESLGLAVLCTAWDICGRGWTLGMEVKVCATDWGIGMWPEGHGELSTVWNANRTYFMLQNFFKNKNKSKKLKLILKNTVIDKMLTWTLTERDRKQLNIFERKVYKIVIEF